MVAAAQQLSAANRSELAAGRDPVAAQGPGLQRAQQGRCYTVAATGAVVTARYAQVMLLEFCQSLPGVDRWGMCHRLCGQH
jgi:hypothetical protein